MRALELLLVAGLFFGMQLVAAVVFIGIYDDPTDVVEVFILAASLPAPFLAAWLTRRNPAELISVERRVRWPIVRRALMVAGPVYGALFLFDVTSGTPLITPTSLATMAVLVAVVPLQSTAEEVIFRASLPQIVGSWVPARAAATVPTGMAAWVRPVVAYGAATAAFVALHVYNWVGLADIFVFSVCASWLTWRTRGIEAAVVLHACGNIVAFSGEAFYPEVPYITDVAVTDAAFSIALTVLLTYGISRACRTAGAPPQGRGPRSRRGTTPRGSTV